MKTGTRIYFVNLHVCAKIGVYMFMRFVGGRLRYGRTDVLPAGITPFNSSWNGPKTQQCEVDKLEENSMVTIAAVDFRFWFLALF